MAKPGDIVMFGEDLCLIFDSLRSEKSGPIEERPEDLRNLILRRFAEGSIMGEALLEEKAICNIEDLNLHEVIKEVLKEKGLL